jgi:rare lipoprotein A
MRYGIKLGVGAVALILLWSCGRGNGDKGLEQAPPAADMPSTGVSDFPVRLGSPYQVGNVTHTPADVPAYDEVGYASWYGEEFAGRNTANGEVFIPSAITAAHKILPMPSYVEITALDTGRTILVRVNDRGPFANDRLIDLSEGAAKQLGMAEQGVAGVRVRVVRPPEQERAVLRSGQSAPTRINTPESLLKILREKLAKMPRPKLVTAALRPVPSAATPAARPAPPLQSRDDRFVREGAVTPRPTSRPSAAPTTAAVGYVVQVAAFSSRARAKDLALKLGATVVTSADGRLFRVRFGPFATEAEGQNALSSAQRRGYPQARLFRE